MQVGGDRGRHHHVDVTSTSTASAAPPLSTPTPLRLHPNRYIVPLSPMESHRAPHFTSALVGTGGYYIDQSQGPHEDGCFRRPAREYTNAYRLNMDASPESSAFHPTPPRDSAQHPAFDDHSFRHPASATDVGNTSWRSSAPTDSRVRSFSARSASVESRGDSGYLGSPTDQSQGDPFDGFPPRAFGSPVLMMPALPSERDLGEWLESKDRINGRQDSGDRTQASLSPVGLEPGHLSPMATVVPAKHPMCAAASSRTTTQSSPLSKRETFVTRRPQLGGLFKSKQQRGGFQPTNGATALRRHRTTSLGYSSPSPIPTIENGQVAILPKNPVKHGIVKILGTRDEASNRRGDALEMDRTCFSHVVNALAPPTESDSPRLVEMMEKRPRSRPLSRSMSVPPPSRRGDGASSLFFFNTSAAGAKAPPSAPPDPRDHTKRGDNEPCILPTLPMDASVGTARYINSFTVNSIVEGKYDDKYDRKLIIDCRYPYEYASGHIKGAINVWRDEDIISLMFQNSMDVPLDGGERTLIVLHCEFTSERAPSAMSLIRQLDRKMTLPIYPKLLFPELYLVRGGFKEVFNTCPQACVGTYRTMRDADFKLQRIACHHQTANSKRRAASNSHRVVADCERMLKSSEDAGDMPMPLHCMAH